MANREDLQPMIRIVRAGQCDACLSPISIMEHDLSISTLSASGYPTDMESAYNEVYGVCTNCGKRFDMIRDGLVYKKYSREAELYKEYRRKNGELNDCDKELRDENPFATMAKEITRRYKEHV